MFWSLVLPFQITCVLVLVAVGAAVGVGLRLGWKTWRVLLGFPLLGAVAFVPSCVAVDMALSPFRFGVFEYERYEDVNDYRIQRFMPPGATEITVRKNLNGCQARYRIAKSDLDTWFDERWTANWVRVHEWHKLKPEERIVSIAESDEGSRWSRFDGLGWSQPADGFFYYGPRARSWAGFDIWYDTETGVAYENTADW